MRTGDKITAFTLIELSVVMLILSLLAAAGLHYASVLRTSTSIAATNASLDIVESALYNYRATFGRLPCPANITMVENAANFGTEVESSGDGLCTGYNFINSSSDPDNGDANYDATSASNVVGGAIPTKALRLADKYAYDAWGHKIFYAVDKRYTTTNAFTTYPVYSYTTVNSINIPTGYVVVKKYNADALTNALTYSAVYALASTGPNGHGGYVRITDPSAAITNCITATGTTFGTNCSTAFGASSTNTDEQRNCHCDSTATATSFNRIFVQNTPNTTNGGANNTMFDDIVRYKTRPQLATNSELQ